MTHPQRRDHHFTKGCRLSAVLWVGPRAFALALPALMLAAGCKRSLEPIAQDLCVQLAATTTVNPPRITLTWPPINLLDTQVLVRRKSPATASFAEPPHTIAAGATSWVDADVQPGVAYDYYVERTLHESHSNSAGFLRAGIELPLVEDRGQIALVIDEAVLASLPTEIARLEEDLRGDGWTTVRALVHGSLSPPQVKDKIRSLYRSAPDRLRQVLLFGHVPVPYSGNIAPDHHSRPIGRIPCHRGAWPADMYYADMDGTWTDTSVDTRTNEFPPSDAINDNLPGDGRFDQGLATTDQQPPRGARGLAPERRGHIALAVGRVDLADMPAFLPQGEIDLLRNYLGKNHRFRHGQLTGERAAVIDDHFGVRGNLSRETPEAKSVTGFATGSALFGPAAVTEGAWLALRKRPTLFGYASGPGLQSSCEGVATTNDLARQDPKVLFSVLWGSFFGDWNHRDNFLRAQIATSVGLASGWGSSPWLLQPLALGATVGDGLLLTQNTAPFVHLALMGDPSLRMFVVPPPTAAVATAANGVTLHWNRSPGPVLGYHVYRADDPDLPARRLTGELLADTGFTDPGPVPAGARYLIRAVKLEVTASGSFFNASQAAFANAPATLPGSHAPGLTPARMEHRAARRPR